ncbi:S1C family serine protease [Gimesia panareensis]|uniref:Serine protease HhoB n=1 Tax=Gimesia panareensis TaxID=2527978 RepID=A0A518A762_9PLAN|nr:trypsin-like peptidase domain-containing protein [Gimesia panareensis]QDT26560.1 Putative serine protease HhoB precursor [Gimesia panareensis]QDU50561.1 Putative serine protease HhoB precursor [Gimesia panareensis]
MIYNRCCLIRKLCLLVAVLSICSKTQADVIELVNGHKVQGDVLKQGADYLLVDIGIEVIRIPADQVRSRTKGDSLSSDKPSVSKSKDKFYSVAQLPAKSIKELARIYGEAVTLVQTPSGLGSGFIINDRGYCVTNYHVVEKETRIAVTIFHRTKTGEFQRRQIKDVEIIALNPFFDLALLRIPRQKDFPFRYVYLAEDDQQREGEEVFAIGNPLGLERSVSRGIISTRNRNMQGIVYIQTTTQINPGNSGGPLFNSRGEVIGVTNMKLILGEGLGFAIPISYVKHFLDNRDAFAFDKTSPNTGYRYFDAPRRKSSEIEK